MGSSVKNDNGCSPRGFQSKTTPQCRLPSIRSRDNGRPPLPHRCRYGALHTSRTDDKDSRSTRHISLAQAVGHLAAGDRNNSRSADGLYPSRESVEPSGTQVGSNLFHDGVQPPTFGTVEVDLPVPRVRFAPSNESRDFRQLFRGKRLNRLLDFRDTHETNMTSWTIDCKTTFAFRTRYAIKRNRNQPNGFFRR